MDKITAQQLKTGGLTGIKKRLKETKELMVQDRGKESCAIIDLQYFNQLKMYELEVAYLKTQEDIKNGNFEIVTNTDKHINELLKEIDNDKNLKIEK